MQKYQYHTEQIEIKGKTLKQAREDGVTDGDVWDPLEDLAYQMTQRQNVFAAEGWQVTATAYVPDRPCPAALITYQRILEE